MIERELLSVGMVARMSNIHIEVKNRSCGLLYSLYIFTDASTNLLFFVFYALNDALKLCYADYKIAALRHWVLVFSHILPDFVLVYELNQVAFSL
jgi:hypothetical protein